MEIENTLGQRALEHYLFAADVSLRKAIYQNMVVVTSAFTFTFTTSTD
jgi:hypothetical protein